MTVPIDSKNILQICLSSSWGGLEMVAFETALKLQENQRKCTTVAPKNSPLAKKLQSNNLAVIEFDTGAGAFWGNVKRLREIFSKENFNCVLVQHLGNLFLLRLALLGRTPPSVVGFSHTFVGVSKKDPYHRWIYKLLSRLVALTPSHAQNLIEHLAIGKEKIVVIPNSVDTNKFSPSKKKEAIRKEFDAESSHCLIGLVGRLDKAKGQNLLIKAASILKNVKDLSGFKIVLVGEETLNEPGILKSLQKRTRELGLENHVIFTGYREDIPEIMASLDVIVMASDAETFGRVIIEAMASGTVVVATRAGGVVDIIDDEVNGLLFNPRDPNGLAQCLATLISHPNLRANLASEALQKARNVYATNAVYNKVTELL